MRIAIHDNPESWSEQWVAHCEQAGISYERVNAYDRGIIARLRDFDAFLWHYTQWRGTDLMIANHVLTAAEYAGLAVFPDHATRWHFDDKLAQKYLLEALNAPLVPTAVFYERDAALAWLKQSTFPLVAKLRRGAGSFNVRLLRNYRQAARYCERLFGRGVSAVPGYLTDIRTKVRKAIALKDWSAVWPRASHYWTVMYAGRRSVPRERGYVLFQEFEPGNQYDIRIAVVGRRAWGFTRDVRPHDFRASGSGAIVYDRSRISMDCVRTALGVARAIHAQSMAFDFVRAPDGRPLICEMSYGYDGGAVYRCEGYWDDALDWHPEHLRPEHAILIDLCQAIAQKKGGQA